MTYKLVIHRKKIFNLTNRFGGIKVYCNEDYLNELKNSLEKDNFIDFGKIILPKKDIAYIKVKTLSEE